MFENILTSFNWLDLLMIIVMAGTIFRGAVQGVVVELFKIIGTLFATIFALHFYTRLAEVMRNAVGLPIRVGEILGFILIGVLSVLIFKLIREGWLLILKVDAKSGFSQWMGALAAIFHSFLICGLLFFMVFLIGNDTLSVFAEKSATGFYLRDLSPKVYEMTYQKVLKKFFPEEEINEKAFKTIKEPHAKKK